MSTAANNPFLALGFHFGYADLAGDSASEGQAAGAGVQAATTATQDQQNIATQQVAAPDPQNTAFTLRMQAAAADAAGMQAELTGISAAGIKKVDESGQAENQTWENSTSQQSMLAAFEQNSRLEPGGETPAPSPANVTHVQTQPETPKAPQSLNQILLQVGQSANERVLVRLVQQPGELRLAVRTDDSELAHGLQQGLSDLIGKLQENGYRAEAWKPVQAPVAAASTAESQNTSNQSHHGDAQSQSGSSQQDGGRRQQDQSNRPRWVEEFESNLTSRGPVSGESYGFTS